MPDGVEQLRRNPPRMRIFGIMRWSFAATTTSIMLLNIGKTSPTRNGVATSWDDWKLWGRRRKPVVWAFAGQEQ